jgi:molybdopterin-guanine dinucleotide biosynthesis protein
MVQDVEEEVSLERIRDTWIRNVDLILTEGYKQAAFPKIEVSLFAGSDRLLCTEAQGLVAVVADHDVPRGVPVFREAEIPRLVDWVEQRYIRGQGSGIRDQGPEPGPDGGS